MDIGAQCSSFHAQSQIGIMFVFQVYQMHPDELAHAYGFSSHVPTSEREHEIETTWGVIL